MTPKVKKVLNYLAECLRTNADVDLSKLPTNANLADPPNFDEDDFNEVFSAILGDAFHYIQRTGVPMQHCAKKSFYVALRDAFFMFEEDALDNVMQKLISCGYTKERIEKRMFYNFSWFRLRVPRIIPPPSILFWRVRNVYATFGGLVDSKLNQPLFNKLSWAKANCVLEEIKRGNISDPPGISFYSHKLDSNGNPKVDKLGLFLYDCNRGTNITENFHKHLNYIFGGWSIGIETSDKLMLEVIHRFNHAMSKRRRRGTPNIGHTDTWLYDELIGLVEDNHGVFLFKDWARPSSFGDTPEQFGTIRLHSDELHLALHAIKLDSQKVKLTRTMKYLGDRMDVPYAPVPMHTEEEYKLFSKLILDGAGTVDFDKIAIKWCDHVDCINIFPKLPVYLRVHHTQFLKNRRSKELSEQSAVEAEKLKQFNIATSRTVSQNYEEMKIESPQPFPSSNFSEGAPMSVAACMQIGETSDERNGVKKGRKKASCINCAKQKRNRIEAEKCRGRFDQKQCNLIEKTNNNQVVKKENEVRDILMRTVPPHHSIKGVQSLKRPRVRTCQQCISVGCKRGSECKGSSKKTLCNCHCSNVNAITISDSEEEGLADKTKKRKKKGRGEETKYDGISGKSFVIRGDTKERLGGATMIEGFTLDLLLTSIAACHRRNDVLMIPFEISNLAVDPDLVKHRAGYTGDYDKKIDSIAIKFFAKFKETFSIGAEVKNYKWIFIPLFLDGCHFVMVAFSIEAKKIQFFDSYKSEREALLVRVRALISKYLFTEVANYKICSRTPDDYPTQTDGVSCGFYACTAAHVILIQNSMDVWDKERLGFSLTDNFMMELRGEFSKQLTEADKAPDSQPRKYFFEGDIVLRMFNLSSSPIT